MAGAVGAGLWVVCAVVWSGMGEEGAAVVVYAKDAAVAGVRG